MKKTLEKWNYNHNEWDVKKEADGITFFDKKLRFKNEFYICANVLGVMQITEDSFILLISHEDDDDSCSCHSAGEYGVIRYRFTNLSPILEYNIAFDEYEFITDDIIMFDELRFYSISNNGELSNLNYWASESDVVSIVPKTKRTKCLLFVSKIDDTEYVAIIIDLKTLQPAPKAFSSLRNSYVEISEDFTFEDLIFEDSDSLDLIKEFLAPAPVEMAKMFGIE